VIKLKNTNNIIKEDIERIHKENIPWSQIEGKTFLISGGAGMIATYIVHTILEFNKKKSKKSTVYIVVKNKKEAEKKFIKYSNNKFLKIIKHDVSKKFNVDEKINYIIHAASNASPKYYKEDPVNTLLPNVLGTKNLLELGIKHKIDGFLFLSSGEIYGDMKKRKILEDSVGKINPLELRSCYAESKRMGENMCVSWNKQFNVPTKIARIFHTYGPGLKLDDGRVFADFVSNIVNNKNIVMKSNGNAKRPFCYITDTITALFLILLKGDNANAYNVSNPSCIISINELAKTLTKLFSNKNLKVIKKSNNGEKYMKSLVMNQIPDISKIRQLGYEPKISIKAGFLRTVESYR
jgi:UDP-glucuronate decarboxylase